VVIFGIILGLVAHAFGIQKFDRWMLLLILGTFTGAYPLMYFAQEFMPLSYAMASAGSLVLAILAVRATSILGIRVAMLGVVVPAAAIMAITLACAVRTNLQGILLTAMAVALFVMAMALGPKLRDMNAPAIAT
jgi:hypothetical protein